MDHSHLIEYVGGAVAGAITLATIMAWLPPIAALLSIVWAFLQIYGWFEKRHNKKKSQRRRVSDK